MAYQTRCVRIRLKPNSLGLVRDWARELNETRREEALATLADEAVVVEAYFLQSTSEGDFLIAFMKARSLTEARDAAKDSSHPIDRFHQDFKRATWDTLEDLELLVDLDRIDDAPK